MGPSPSRAAQSYSFFLSFVVRSLAVCSLGLLILAGCASSDSGTAEVSGSMYYGAGFHDPWYYGAAYYPPDIIVTPPARPVDPPHVEQPIALRPTPRPLPSIPSTPRPAFHR